MVSSAPLFRSVGLIAFSCSYASAFVVPSNAKLAPGTAVVRRVQTSIPAADTRSLFRSGGDGSRLMKLSAEKKEEEEQEPMDLDLEQMFEVFEAADKEISDEDVGKKSGTKPRGESKDPAEAMGDMLSSFFGGGDK